MKKQQKRKKTNAQDGEICCRRWINQETQIPESLGFNAARKIDSSAFFCMLKRKGREGERERERERDNLSAAGGVKEAIFIVFCYF